MGMTTVDEAWRYPLFEALYGRRSRRVARGFAISEGPLQYVSRAASLPLSELEEAVLVAAGAGITGTPLWDMGRPAALRLTDGRTFPSTARGRRTALFFTNDSGVFVMDPAATTPTTRDTVLDVYRRHRRALGTGRLAIPREVPPFFGHNLWDSNMPGATLFLPVVDVSLTLIGLISQLVDGDGGRFVRGHGGGMSIVDDRHGGRPAGTERWLSSGLIDPAKVLPLSILERHACYFMFSEPAAICQNIFLATEALGLGGWMHCGFLSLRVLEALGFRLVTAGAPAGWPNPVGLDGVLEGYCPPYFPTMDAAVDAALARLSRVGPVVETSEAGVACTKAVCTYIHETFGRFPATVDTMHLMWLMQAHHLDLDFDDRFFGAGAYSRTHAGHLAAWHPDDTAGRLVP
jgi:hypothetical protein